MRYYDSSAIAKLVLAENESGALRDFLGSDPKANITSVIARTEVALAIARQRGNVERSIAEAADAMQIQGFTFHLVDVDPEAARAAATIGSAHGLRALDALHIATAMQFARRLTEVITYDERMASACRSLGLPVVRPGA